MARGHVLELLRPDDSGKLQVRRRRARGRAGGGVRAACCCRCWCCTHVPAHPPVPPPTHKHPRPQVIYSTDVFGVIRHLGSYRFPGGQQDFVVCGSDSGRIVILQYNKERNEFTKLHQETFGKSGVRRIVPGEYLAVDPKGRCCMIAAVEKNKFVYVLNRGEAGVGGGLAGRADGCVGRAGGRAPRGHLRLHACPPSPHPASLPPCPPAQTTRRGSPSPPPWRRTRATRWCSRWLRWTWGLTTPPLLP